MRPQITLQIPLLPNSDSIAPTGDLVGGNMTRAFSDDLRSRVLAASRDGMSARSAAARFGIGISTAIAWIASARAGSSRWPFGLRRNDRPDPVDQEFFMQEITVVSRIG
jgi:transposase-like protein